MKIAIVLLVCFAALVSAADVPAAMDSTSADNAKAWKDWATQYRDPATPDNKFTVRIETAAKPAYSYIISDAGSGATRMIIGVKGVGEVTITGLIKCVTPDATDASKPKVLKAFEDVVTAYPAIRFVALGATAGARNEMWVKDSADVANRLAAMCPALQTASDTANTKANVANRAQWECRAGIMQGAVEGFLGWYHAWLKQASPKANPFCYMELGGMSTQLAASKATTKKNIVGTLNSDDISVAVVSGYQIGFNVIGSSELNTASNSAAAAALNVCDQSKLNLGDCKTAVAAFYKKDAGLQKCLTTDGYAAEIKTTCAAGITVRGAATPFQEVNNGILPVPADYDWTKHAACKKDTAITDDNKWKCARWLMWNEFFTQIFGTTPPTAYTSLNNIEWFEGLKAIFAANKFDGELLEIFLKNKNDAGLRPIQSATADATGDCVKVTGDTGFTTSGQRQRTSLRLHARAGRRMSRLSGLRLKF